MKKFPHQQFIEDNQIDLDILPHMLQKRIKGFEELEEDLRHTTEHDRQQLFDKLESLSHEIEEDLEEEFGDRLENNDEQADEQEESIPMEKKEDEIVPELTVVPEMIVEETSNEIEVPVSSDEELLNKFYTSKQLQLLPSQLIQNGFKTDLDRRIVKIGKYALHRGKYDKCFQLLLTK